MEPLIMLTRHLTNSLLRAMDGISHGEVTLQLPDGRSYSFSGAAAGASAHIIIHRWDAISKLAQKGDIGFAESYRDGEWDAQDVSTLLLFALQNEQALQPYIHGSAFIRALSRLAYYFTRNNLQGSRRNIRAHYDLGNEFYKLWLDPSMTYSSALYAIGEEELQVAQNNKYDRILNRLNTKSGRMLEVGCGWGGFAERAHQHGDFELKGITLSTQQYDYAKKRLAKTQSTISLEDYRHQTGHYDQIVSIEMFEAVGEQYWPVYFSKIKSLLAARGNAMIQTITIGEEHFERYRNSGDVIRTHIFPGGMLPSPERFVQEANKAGLKVTDSYAFGQDYATTLKNWLNNFDAKKEQIRSLGYDEKFIRLWRFYLASCYASFTIGRTDVMQMELAHA
jgi:cyclopropane-fatty-acyl-phospholipid synthase